MLPFIRTLFGNPSSSYLLGRQSKVAINQARERVANLINANPDEIIFTSGGTESNNLAIQGIANANRDHGNHIITSAIEHPAVSNVCKHLAALGYEITWLPVDRFGRVNPKDLERAICPATILISVMHANNEIGTVQPIKEIAELAQTRNIIFHTDAAQSLGKIRTDVQQLGVDLLSIAGHKLYAPKGIGALYIKRGTSIKNLMFGAGQENGLRPGTENVMQIAGLGKACEISQRDFKVNVDVMLSTKERMLKGLIHNLGDRIQVNGEPSNTLPNTLSIAFAQVEAHSLVSAINKDLCLSTGSACHADSIEISSVLKAMNLDPKMAAGTVRISTGKHTTVAEVDHAIELISNAVLKQS
jgi:cysteine desulfurase